MKTQIYSMDAKPLRELTLPAQFEQAVNEQLIYRAVLSDYSSQYQPKGSYVWAGMETSAKYKGRKEDFGSAKNHGIAMLPREVLAKGRFGKVRRIPSSVKGRRAHPPHVEKRLYEAVNKKEYAKALLCALSASAQKVLVQKRGHKFADTLSVPPVLERKCEELSKTKQIASLFSMLGMQEDLNRATRRKVRTGLGGTRRGGVRTPCSVLLVAPKGSKILKASRNICGVDAVSTQKLRCCLLAPGTHAGRLTVFTEGAIEEIAKMQ
ncbi:50S ribosomal protein L4 [Candidatus Micrarchaeota archaeon]|nr:50S ribosomal protein L4 [Candidatus Micrarchaeota archaeon]